MRDLNGKLTLVTGAASGIGRETAKQLAQAGARLILCDVNEDGLRAIEAEVNGISECVLASIVDVSDTEAMRAFADEVHANHGTLDILVNNAGVGISSSIINTTLDDWDWVLGINLKGVIHGLQFFVPPMVERGSGHVVNVASIVCFFVGVGATAYITSKFAVFGMYEATREDLAGTGVNVSTICPGFTNTGFISNSRMRGYEDDPDKITRVDETYAKLSHGPALIARAIVKSIRKRKKIVPVSPEAWFLYYLTRISPWASRRFGHFLANTFLN